MTYTRTRNTKSSIVQAISVPVSARQCVAQLGRRYYGEDVSARVRRGLQNLESGWPKDFLNLVGRNSRGVRAASKSKFWHQLPQKVGFWTFARRIFNMTSLV